MSVRGHKWGARKIACKIEITNDNSMKARLHSQDTFSKPKQSTPWSANETQFPLTFLLAFQGLPMYKYLFSKLLCKCLKNRLMKVTN